MSKEDGTKTIKTYKVSTKLYPDLPLQPGEKFTFTNVDKDTIIINLPDFIREVANSPSARNKMGVILLAPNEVSVLLKVRGKRYFSYHLSTPCNLDDNVDENIDNKIMRPRSGRININ